jgi:hypothetical protein
MTDSAQRKCEQSKSIEVTKIAKQHDYKNRAEHYWHVPHGDSRGNKIDIEL